MRSKNTFEKKKDLLKLKKNLHSPYDKNEIKRIRDMK